MTPRRVVLRERPLIDRGNHGRELPGGTIGPHPGEVRVVIGGLAGEGGVVTPVVADLVQHGPSEEVARLDLLLAVRPGNVFPGDPVASLSVTGEEEDLP